MQEKLWDNHESVAMLGRRVRLYCDTDQTLTDEALGQYLLGANPDTEVFFDADGIYFYDKGVCFLQLDI